MSSGSGQKAAKLISRTPALSNRINRWAEEVDEDENFVENLVEANFKNLSSRIKFVV